MPRSITGAVSFLSRMLFGLLFDLSHARLKVLFLLVNTQGCELKMETPKTH
jgi:hypothetical protein